MFWPVAVGAKERPAPFQPKLRRPAKAAVVLLGAGSSASLGAPLMRDFGDFGRDFLELNRFDEMERPSVEATLKLHSDLRSQLQITELDLDNVENLLSIAELSTVIPKLRQTIPSLDATAATSVRRFIEAVLVKSIRVPAPASAKWVGIRQEPPHKTLVAALSILKGRATVVTLNYDCALEYVCHCMGVPFTYHRDDCPDALEILKLHGSMNWLQCEFEKCAQFRKPLVAEVRFSASSADKDTGTIEPIPQNCVNCGRTLRPLIVPPVWAKPLHEPVLQRTWSRAFDVLSQAETLVAIGYSLPLADTKVRELFHVGLMPGQLRQATVTVGSDESAAQRWTSLFRESWRENRLSLRNEKFELLANGDHFLMALSIFERRHDHFWFPPLAVGPATNDEMLEKISHELRARNVEVDRSDIDWCAVVRQMRAGEPVRHETTANYRAVLSSLGLDWVPDGNALPMHGHEFPADLDT